MDQWKPYVLREIELSIPKQKVPKQKAKRRRWLVVNEQVKRRIAEVVKYARANRMNAWEMQVLAEAVDRGEKVAAVGDNPSHVVAVPRGYICVYSEQQDRGGKWMRHLSVSVDTRGNWPHPIAVNELLPLFGFTHKFEHESVLVYEEAEAEAINLLQEIESSEE